MRNIKELFWENGLPDKDFASFWFCIEFVHMVHTICERMVFLMDYDKIVCNCCQVTNGMIKEAVDSGADTLEKVQEVTGAGTVCGACLENVRNLVEQFLKEQK